MQLVIKKGVSIGDKNRETNISIFEIFAKVSKSKEEAERLDEAINYDKLPIVDKNNKEVTGFAKDMDLDLFAKRTFYGSISLKKAETMQDKMESKIEELKKYNPRIQERKGLRNRILDNAQKLFEGRDAMIEAFGKHIF